MNDLLPLCAAVLLRASWIMGVALLLVGLLSRRRPLAASSLLTSTFVALLLLPLLVVVAPALAVPVAFVRNDQADAPVSAPASQSDTAAALPMASSDADSQRDSPEPVQPAVMPASAPNPEGTERLAARTNDLMPERRDPARASHAASSFWRGLSVHWPTYLMVVYFVGVLVLGMRLLAGMWLIRRLRQTATAVNGDWHRRLELWQQRLGITSPVELRATNLVTIPLTVGWKNPVILLPTSLLQALSPHQDAVLLHELAHIRRQDFASLVLLHLVQAVYWCHPLTWLLGSMGRQLRERACDDLCIHWLTEGDGYRTALLAIAKQTICRPRLSLGLAMADASRLSRRLAQIDRSRGSDRCVAQPAARFAGCCGMLTIAALAGLIHFVPREAAASNPSTTDQSAVEQKSTAVAGAADKDQASASTVSKYELHQAALENNGAAPESLVAVLGTSKLKHWSFVRDVAWTPDGKMLASVGGDGCLRLWDPDTGEQHKRFKSKALWLNGFAGLSSLAFDPAGKNVAVGLSTNAVRIWEIETGKQTHLLKDDGSVLDVAWHSKQPLLATGGEHVARIWNLSTGAIVRSLDSQNKAFKRKSISDNVHVAFTPDGQEVIVGHPDGSIQFWNVATGDVTRTIAAHQVAIQALAIDAGNDRFATGGYEGKLRIWRLSSGELVRDLQAQDRYIQGLAFHPSQDAIYTSGLEGTIRKWDLRTGERLLEFRASLLGGPGNLAVHPTRDLVASTGLATRLWNAANGKSHLEFTGHVGAIQSLAFTPDGSRLISASYDAVDVWDPASQALTNAYPVLDNSAPKNLQVLPDSRAFVMQSSRLVDVRNIDGGAILKSWTPLGDLAEAVACSSDGKWLAATTFSRSEQGNLLVCNLASGKVHASLSTHRGHPYFSSDGKKLLLVGSEYRLGAGTKSRLSVWDVEKKEQTLTLEDIQGLAGIQATALSTDGGTLAIAGNAYDANEKDHQQLVFWDWSKNETRLVVDMQGHWPGMMAFAPDGRSLVTAAARKGDVRIWDPRDGSLRETINLCEESPWSIGAVAYAADSRQVAVGMWNGTIYILRPQAAPESVPVKVAVPAVEKEPEPDQWKRLIGQAAPELQADGWLFGEPTSLEKLHGRWTILYFWNSAYSEQDMPALMNLQDHFGDRGPAIIAVMPFRAESVEQEQAWFERMSRDWWEGRTLPFRVLLDKRKPNVIPGTKIETGGATSAAYRVMEAHRGYRTESLTLLISPEGIVKQAISNRPSAGELSKATGLTAQVPPTEKAFFQEYTLPAGKILRRMGPPYSQARQDYRFTRFGRTQATMIFEQAETLKWRTASFSSPERLEFVLNHAVGLQNYEFVDPDKILDRTIEGDWCFRSGASPADRLAALQQILHDELNWTVRFERETVKQQVIVASGNWKQAPLSDVDPKLGIFLTVDDAPNPTIGGGGSGSFDELLGSLGDRIRYRFVSEVAAPPKERLQWQDRLADPMRDLRERSPAGKERLGKLLHNLARQTGLTFREEERDIPVWRIFAE